MKDLILATAVELQSEGKNSAGKAGEASFQDGTAPSFEEVLHTVEHAVGSMEKEGSAEETDLKSTEAPRNTEQKNSELCAAYVLLLFNLLQTEAAAEREELPSELGGAPEAAGTGQEAAAEIWKEFLAAEFGVKADSVPKAGPMFEPFLLFPSDSHAARATDVAPEALDRMLNAVRSGTCGNEALLLGLKADSEGEGILAAESRGYQSAAGKTGLSRTEKLLAAADTLWAARAADGEASSATEDADLLQGLRNAVESDISELSRLIERLGVAEPDPGSSSEAELQRAVNSMLIGHNENSGAAFLDSEVSAEPELLGAFLARFASAAEDTDARAVDGAASEARSRKKLMQALAYHLQGAENSAGEKVEQGVFATEELLAQRPPGDAAGSQGGAPGEQADRLRLPQAARFEGLRSEVSISGSNSVAADGVETEGGGNEGGSRMALSFPGTESAVEAAVDSPGAPSTATTFSAGQQVPATAEATLHGVLEQVDPREIIDQLVTRIRLNKNGREFDIQLEPERLGRVRTRLTMDDGLLTVRFMAEESAVRDIVRSNMAQLRSELAASGFEDAAISVGVGDSWDGDEEEGRFFPRQNPGSTVHKQEESEIDEVARSVAGYTLGTIDYRT